MSGIKRPLSLDFNQTKKNLDIGPVLSSPDLQILKVGTPELNDFILGQNPLSTPTPSQGNPNAILFPRSVTEEQENFSAGFVNALNNLHNSSSQDCFVASTSDSNSTVYTDMEQPAGGGFVPTIIKEEPQTVPNTQSSPPMSPVDMEHQERIKLERKRMRNRLAASKCRSRKLERISKLEDKVKLLKAENTDLAGMITQMRDQVNSLKVEVLEHVNQGCEIIL
ncbi:transcription factor JunD-like isoform X1 [Atheta coriaria]|uniref:transcription factor JunD-like isoform X1 n=1 Tax=Dalotia coriaria TaxID=877792 RepID=UPI0031F40998